MQSLACDKLSINATSVALELANLFLPFPLCFKIDQVGSSMELSSSSITEVLSPLSPKAGHGLA